MGRNGSFFLARLARRRQWSIAHGVVVLAVLVGGVGLSFSLWRTLEWWEGRTFQTELTARAESRAKLLDASLTRSVDVLNSIAAFMGQRADGQATGSGVTREQFRRFVSGPLA